MTSVNMIQCSYCQKEYHLRKKTFYDRHVILCEMVHQSMKNIDEDEELVPSRKEIYKILKELTIQNKKLQDKVSELEKIIQRGGCLKKIDILEKLNFTIKPSLTFQDWVKQMIITQEDVSSLNADNFSFVSHNILSRNIESAELDLPIISNDLKKNNIYIFRVPIENIENDDIIYYSEPKWIKMDNDDFLLIIKTLYQYILKCYHLVWKENNKNIHHFDEISGKILDKITNIKINNHNDNHNRKIYNSLYTLVSKQI
jgi:hypothetical protein